LVPVDLPSVAQTNIFAVGCVANATGVDGWELSDFLYDSGRMWLVLLLAMTRVKPLLFARTTRAANDKKDNGSKS